MEWRELTEKQMRSWGVKHHELHLGKPYADLFIDDKAINVSQWMIMGEDGVDENTSP